MAVARLGIMQGKREAIFATTPTGTDWRTTLRIGTVTVLKTASKPGWRIRIPMMTDVRMVRRLPMGPIPWMGRALYRCVWDTGGLIPLRGPANRDRRRRHT